MSKPAYYLYREHTPRWLRNYRAGNGIFQTLAVIAGIFGAMWLLVVLMVVISSSSDFDVFLASWTGALIFGPIALCEAALALSIKMRIFDPTARSVYVRWSELPEKPAELAPLYNKIMRDAQAGPQGVSGLDLELFADTVAEINRQNAMLKVTVPDPAVESAQAYLSLLREQNRIYSDDT